jgi:hypothetical protein
MCTEERDALALGCISSDRKKRHLRSLPSDSIIVCIVIAYEHPTTAALAITVFLENVRFVSKLPSGVEYQAIQRQPIRDLIAEVLHVMVYGDSLPQDREWEVLHRIWPEHNVFFFALLLHWQQIWNHRHKFLSNTHKNAIWDILNCHSYAERRHIHLSQFG